MVVQSTERDGARTGLAGICCIFGELDVTRLQNAAAGKSASQNGYNIADIKEFLRLNGVSDSEIGGIKRAQLNAKVAALLGNASAAPVADPHTPVRPTVATAGATSDVQLPGSLLSGAVLPSCCIFGELDAARLQNAAAGKSASQNGYNIADMKEFLRLNGVPDAEFGGIKRAQLNAKVAALLGNASAAPVADPHTPVRPKTAAASGVQLPDPNLSAPVSPVDELVEGSFEGGFERARVEKAAEGKSLSRGGLNMDEIVRFLEDIGVAATHLTRPELNAQLQSYLCGAGGHSGADGVASSVGATDGATSEPSSEASDGDAPDQSFLDDGALLERTTTASRYANDACGLTAACWLKARLPPAMIELSNRGRGNKQSQYEPGFDELCRPFGIATSAGNSSEELLEMMVDQDPLQLVDLLYEVALADPQRLTGAGTQQRLSLNPIRSAGGVEPYFSALRSAFAVFLQDVDGGRWDPGEIKQRATSKLLSAFQGRSVNAPDTYHFVPADDVTVANSPSWQWELEGPFMDTETVDRIYSHCHSHGVLETAQQLHPADAVASLLAAAYVANGRAHPFGEPKLLTKAHRELITGRSHDLFCWAIFLQHELRPELQRLVQQDCTARYTSAEAVDAAVAWGWVSSRLPDGERMMTPACGSAYEQYHHRPWKKVEPWFLPGPADAADLPGMSFLLRKNSERVDWQRLLSESESDVQQAAKAYLAAPNSGGRPDFDVWMQFPPADSTESAQAMNELFDSGDPRVSFVRPPGEPPLIVCSFAGNDRRSMAGGLYDKAGAHSGADPWAICDFIRDYNGWSEHRIYIDTEVHESYEKWKWSYTWAQRKAKAQLIFVSEQWLRSPFCRGELKTVQEVVRVNPAIQIIFVVLASPTVRFGAEEGEALRAAFAEGFVQPGRGQRVHCRGCDAHVPAAECTTASNHSWCRECSAERLVGAAALHGEVLATVDSDVGKFGYDLDVMGWVRAQAQQLVHDGGLADEPRVYDMHFIWQWITSKGLQKTDLKNMSTAIVQLATDLKALEPSACHILDECAEFLARDDPLDLGFHDGSLRFNRDLRSRVGAGWAGLAWAPPVRVRNRHLDDTQRIDVNTASVGVLMQKAPGVGKVFATRIVHERSRRGPYATLEELAHGPRRVIGRGTLEKMWPFMTARQMQVEGREEQRNGRTSQYYGDWLLKVIWQVDGDGNYKAGSVAGPFLDADEAIQHAKAKCDEETGCGEGGWVSVSNGDGV
jgi:hypothetical protein